MIDVQRVSHAFGSKPVLSDVSFQAGPGKVVGLVGPNAAGKTTLIRTIVSLLRPSAGRVLVDGTDVMREPRRARASLGYLPERATTYGELLAWEYVDFFAELAGVRGAERRAKVQAALARAGLAAVADRPTQELSKGVRQRLAMAAVTLHVPAVLVLDEPTDGLDPQSREQLLANVRAFADGGATVLISSHVLAEIEQVADEVVILVAGRVQATPTAPAAGRFAFRVPAEQAARALDLLAAHPDVAKAAIEAGWHRIELRAGIAHAAPCAAALVRAGIDLIELREDRDDLRHRFLRAVDQEKA